MLGPKAESQCRACPGDVKRGLRALALPRSIRDTSPPWRLYLFVVMYGFGHGGLRPESAAATADLFPGRHLGTILGVVEAGYDFGGAFRA
jgi:MFS family permease